ncbi:chloride channel C [Prunus dulcis]|uniref:Chloride channel C n=1 Tax=Prunus dulcis TaxID=3755 RepID=A0A4Y1QP08_PRUDU|nr:chloride channel C [Prunus dulcis]
MIMQIPKKVLHNPALVSLLIVGDWVSLYKSLTSLDENLMYFLLPLRLFLVKLWTIGGGFSKNIGCLAGLFWPLFWIYYLTGPDPNSTLEFGPDPVRVRHLANVGHKRLFTLLLQTTI